MATWFVRLDEQAPLKVVVADERDLIAEFHAILAERRWWRFWSRPKFWALTDEALVAIDAVVGIDLRGSGASRRQIGF